MSAVSPIDPDKRLVEFFNTLLFETPSGQRFTQDSPVLANVWLAYARQPREPQDLILTVSKEHSAGKAARQLRKMLEKLRGGWSLLGERSDEDKAAPDFAHRTHRDKEPVSMVYLPGQIAVRLYFDELMRVVLPSTPWWAATVATLCGIAERYETQRAELVQNATVDFADLPASPDWHHFPIDSDDRMRFWITEGLMLMRRGIGGNSRNRCARDYYVRDLPIDFIWLIRIAGILSYLANGDDHELTPDANGSFQVPCTDDAVTNSFDLDFRYRDFEHGNTINRMALNDNDRIVQTSEQARAAREQVVDAFFAMYTDWKSDLSKQPETSFIWRVTKNRTASLAINESSLTVKADAARRLFEISCKDITWAIVDSGIDGNHPAFKDTSELEYTGDVSDLPNRITCTLDFTNLREILDPEYGHENSKTSDRMEALIDTLVRRRTVNVLEKGSDEYEKVSDRVRREISRLHKRIKEGNDIDWELLEPLIKVNSARRPRNDHGTHVAGILGADWVNQDAEWKDTPLKLRPRRMRGTCPQINLIDCRVFPDDGNTEEFEILAAIQFLRWMNSRAGYTLVHGANLSFSLLHEVRRFACGQTPICIECNEAAALGMVIVAAAGNHGYEAWDLQLTGRKSNYEAISITDPGNADGVITVGATHRKRPHEYGVSYFSSRGPTGDGRIKPDLVAPGEKIKGPTPDGREDYKDGTSMAAPHVSGAAAMLMSRHKELCGKPARIKQILCDTATDLGREPYFQGHGLLDILRALQSL